VYSAVGKLIRCRQWRHLASASASVAGTRRLHPLHYDPAIVGAVSRALLLDVALRGACGTSGLAPLSSSRASNRPLLLASTAWR
jgi:hypothetical protein